MKFIRKNAYYIGYTMYRGERFNKNDGLNGGIKNVKSILG